MVYYDSSIAFYFTLFDVVVVSLAIVANCIVLIAVVRSKMSQIGYRRFLTSLSAGDLFICVVHALTLVYQHLLDSCNKEEADDLEKNNNDNNNNLFFSCGAAILRTLKLAGFLATLLNICGMSVDHLIAIAHPLRYKQIMRKHAARLAVAAVWLISFLTAILGVVISAFRNNGKSEVGSGIFKNPFRKDDETDDDYNPYIIDVKKADSKNILKMLAQTDPLPSPPSTAGSMLAIDKRPLVYIDKASKVKASLEKMLSMLQEEEERQDFQLQNRCFIAAGEMLVEIVVIAMVLVCFLLLIACYGFIFKKVSSRIESSLSSQGNKKTIVTTLFVLGAFMICWMPFILNEFAMLLIFEGKTIVNPKEHSFNNFFLIGQILTSLLMIYPLIDPIIYAARIPAIQQYILLNLSLMVRSDSLVRHLNKHNQQLFVSRTASANIYKISAHNTRSPLRLVKSVAV